MVEKLGYTRVYNVRDGITRWIREGLPVSRI
jgi:rhodanese-related sulfurtransferase